MSRVDAAGRDVRADARTAAAVEPTDFQLGLLADIEAGKGSASQAPGSPVRCGASAGVLTCALPRHGGDRHTSPDGAFWYGAGGRRG